MNNNLCAHCKLPSNNAIVEGDLTFCCNGCQNIYHLLQDNNLESFYDKLGANTLHAPQRHLADSARFDSAAFAQKYIKPTQNGYSEISFVISGIHCAACIWLNEKIITKADGVIEASINFTNHKAKIIFDTTKIRPSQLVERIRSIGYDAKPYDASMQEQNANAERKESYFRMIVAVFASMNIMWIALALYLGYFGTIEQSHKNVLHFAEFMLASLTIFYSGWPFFKGAYYAGKNGFVTMDTLIAVGSSLTYAYSCYAAVIEYGEVYFDSVTMIITFVLIGKFLEAMTKKKAVDTLDTISAFTPVEAIILRNGQEKSVALDSVAVGDIVVLKAGDYVPVDGIITNGCASFDESSISGEAIPIYKNEGAEVKSSSICLDATVYYRASKVFADSHIGVLSRMLEDALAKKPKIETLANKLSRHFSLTILSISVLTFVGWLVSGASFENSLMIAVSVIIIACPCALALATPIACVVGLAVGAKKDVIFKSSSAFDALCASKTLFLDKTGTITEGRLAVKHAKINDGFNEPYLAAILNASKHPVAKSIKDYLGKNQEIISCAIEIKNGMGIIAVFENQDVAAGGSYALMQELCIEVQKPKDDFTYFYFSVNGVCVGTYCLEDTIRAEAKGIIRQIKLMNINPIMLTGDLNGAAKRVASEVGISEYSAELKPQDKLQIVKDAQSGNGVVTFVGDGFNDAPALALADASMAMPNAADASLACADVILLKPSLQCVVNAFEIARQTDKTIKQNLAISIIYNAATIPLAVCGYVIPLVAAASMSLSSILVVGNSLRLGALIKKDSNG